MEASMVSHIAICVQDVEKSLGFLPRHSRHDGGLRPGPGHHQRRPAQHLQALPQDPSHHPRPLRPGQNRAVAGADLPPRREDPDGEPIKLDQVGISHISFTVPDVKALADELVSKGVELAAPLEGFTAPDGRVSSIFVYDPDGILVQFDDHG